MDLDLAGVGGVSGPVVVDQDAAEGRQQADAGERRPPALGMDCIEGQGRGAQHRQPLQRPGDAQPRFVGMGDRLVHEGLSDLRHRRGQRGAASRPMV
jgi:hypothetical protein